METSELKIIQKAQRGDRMAFRQLVMEHSERVFRLAWRLMGSEDAANDVVQDSFLKAWTKLDQFDGRAQFSTWLHRITVNTAMDALRKQSSRTKVEAPELEREPVGEPSACPAETDDLRRQMQVAMKSLTDVERAALMLRHFEGHSIAEISAMLKINGSAAKQAIFRAVRKMRETLTPPHEQEGYSQ